MSWIATWRVSLMACLASVALGDSPQAQLQSLGPGSVANKRIDFRHGAPTTALRLMEGHTEARFGLESRIRFRIDGVATDVVGEAGSQWTIRRMDGRPAVIDARILLAEMPFSDKVAMREALDEWRSKGLLVTSKIVGGVYGVRGKIVDNRRYVIVVDEPPARPSALAQRQEQILKAFGVRTTLYESIETPSSISLELVDADGKVRLKGHSIATVHEQSGFIEVKRVEFGVGYDFHNFEDRRYRGDLEFAADRFGTIAVINHVAIEDLLKGLVPAEIFPKAHPQALKAQAVTARGEILAKVGLKHLADPYLLCAEQHCAVYRGLIGEVDSTTAAVEATRGEALFDATGRLVDSVYSAVCGGHTENNESVWGGAPNASLRGRPDLLTNSEPGVSPNSLHSFLSSSTDYACRVASLAQPNKFRWERRLSAHDVDEKFRSLGIGRVMAMAVVDRGVSGRARLMSVSGDTGATIVKGELNIRRIFGMLNSSMFEVSAQRDRKGKPLQWIFSGGGWGHGVGMCQTGAIGRAERGQNYHEILDFYFSGAVTAPIY